MYFHSHAFCIAQMQEDMYDEFAPKLKFKTWKILFLDNVTPSSNADSIEHEVERHIILCRKIPHSLCSQLFCGAKTAAANSYTIEHL